MFILSSSTYQEWGQILDDLNKSYAVLAIKTIRPTLDQAHDVTNIIQLNDGQSNSSSQESFLVKREGIYLFSL